VPIPDVTFLVQPNELGSLFGVRDYLSNCGAKMASISGVSNSLSQINQLSQLAASKQPSKSAESAPAQTSQPTAADQDGDNDGSGGLDIEA
jgi:hypothetical protein